jgi:hypothetical protein
LKDGSEYIPISSTPRKGYATNFDFDTAFKRAELTYLSNSHANTPDTNYFVTLVMEL